MGTHSRKKRRKVNEMRPWKRRIHITCEGRETEKNYLYELKRTDVVTEHYTVKIKSANGRSREMIACAAVDHKKQAEMKEPFDEYWCVFDVEGPSHHDSLRKALQILTAQGITWWLSNPSFEVWFLAHFMRTAASFMDGDRVLEGLQKEWKKIFNQPYVKGDTSIFRKLHDRLETAIVNANWVLATHHCADCCGLETNSATDIGRLVETLQKAPQKRRGSR